jgi:hypothetical protein
LLYCVHCQVSCALVARLQRSAALASTPRSQGRCNAYRQAAVSDKKLKVAINGFGRIGRQFLRCWHGRGESLLDVVVINDSGGPKQASHLLKYDSTFGTFDADVAVRLDFKPPLPVEFPPARLGLCVTCYGDAIEYASVRRCPSPIP